MFSLIQNQVIANQLKRQSEDVNRLRETLDAKSANEAKLEQQVRLSFLVAKYANALTRMLTVLQVRDAKRQYADLETRMKEELMLARIKEAENSQRIAELTQKISGLEYKVRTALSLCSIQLFCNNSHSLLHAEPREVDRGRPGQLRGSVRQGPGAAGQDRQLESAGTEGLHRNALAQLTCTADGDGVVLPLLLLLLLPHSPRAAYTI